MADFVDRLDGPRLGFVAGVPHTSARDRGGVPSVPVQARKGDTVISVFDQPNGIARFLLNGLAADERQHVIDVVRRQDLADLERIQAEGRLVSAAEIVAEILLVDDRHG